MDTGPDTRIHYITKRQEILDAIAAHDTKIERLFFINRCLDGLQVVVGVITLLGVAIHNNRLTILAVSGTLFIGIIAIVAGIPQSAEIESRKKVHQERQLQILDEMWYQPASPHIPE